MTSLITITSAIITTALPVNPVQAAGDTSISVGDSTCNLPVAELGLGSAKNPFRIGSAKALAEIGDCRTRSFTISGATVNGTQVTYTSNNALGVGHSVTISGITPSDFNVATARVLASTSSTFTVDFAQTISATYSSGGSVAVDRDFYEFTADIDLSSGTESWNNVSTTGWSPIPATSFISIDGKNRTINGLTIVQNASNLGLFAELSNSNVSNLKFTNVSIDQSGSSRHSNVGALVGTAENVNATGINVQGSVTGNDTNVGLLAGNWASGNIRDSSTSGVVGVSNTGFSPKSIGGLAGRFYFGNVINSSSSATVNGFADTGTNVYYGTNIGGLIGELVGNIDESSASGNVFGREYVGGLGGVHCCGGVTNSFATGDVTAMTNLNSSERVSNVGGLLGETCCGGVSNSYATGKVTAISRNSGGGISRVGGLLGFNSCCAGTNNNYSTGAITVTVEQTSGTINIEKIGGSVGDWACCGGDFNNSTSSDITIVNNSSGTVKNVGGYAGYVNYEGQFEAITSSGNISITTSAGGSSESIGGFAGFNQGEFKYLDVHASGNVVVNNGSKIGGLIGLSWGPTQIIDSSATGNVTASFDGDANIGGLIGEINQPGSNRSRTHSFERSSTTGSITVTPLTSGQNALNVGGLIGYVKDTVTMRDTFVRSNVNGSSFVGGLFGATNNSSIEIRNVYVANTVTTSGTNATSDPVSNGAYIDTSSTNIYDSTLGGLVANKANFTPKTTAEMKAESTFSSLGWNIAGEKSVWLVNATKNGGYPYLRARPTRTSNSSSPETAVPSAPSTSGSPTGGATSGTSPSGSSAGGTTVQTCIPPQAIAVSFADGSSKLSPKAKRQLKQYVASVKTSNCKTVRLQASYVKNSPLARTRNRVIVTSLKNEFWRQQYVVRIVTSIRAEKSIGSRVRTVQIVSK